MDPTNTVTAADIGRRVSFQFILPNGLRKEAVGVLEFWDEAARTYMVRDKQGDILRVPARDVKHGKPVG